MKLKELRSDEKSLIFYGGSFNPVHLAHLMFAVYLSKRFPEAQIFVAPTYRHAFDKTLADYDLRTEMLRAAFEGIASIEISLIEKTLNLPKSRTYDCIVELRRLFPDTTIAIAIGEDLTKEFHLWKNAEMLAEMCKFVVVPRHSYSEYAFLPDISSTRIRESVAEGRAEDIRAFMPENAYRIMLRNGLYRKINE